MRHAPPQVLETLRSIWPEIGLEWDPQKHLWQVTVRGLRQHMALMHRDGRPMLSLDGYTDEIVAQLHQADNHRDSGDRLKAMDRAPAQRRYLTAQAEEKRQPDLERQTDDVTRVFTNGVTPMVYPGCHPAPRPAAA